jgi:hypothetical protein
VASFTSEAFFDGVPGLTAIKTEAFGDAVSAFLRGEFTTRLATIPEGGWRCREGVDIHGNRKGGRGRSGRGRGRVGMRWDREMVRLRKWGRFTTFVLSFDLALMKVGVDLDDSILPCGESIRAIDNADKVVLDSRLETLHETIDFGLLSHVEMGGEFEEAS